MSEESEREARLIELASKRVVYTLPGMEALPVRRDLRYRSAAGDGLLMDLYRPSAAPGRAVPAVLIAMAYPDPESRIRAFGPLTSWARLLAASGMAAVVYGTRTPDEDACAVLERLRADATDLGLDPERLGVLATSGNATVALSLLMRDRRLRCAALLCGVTMDLGGSTTVADMSRRFGFVDACAGRSADDLPVDVPVLAVRAGLDGFQGLNAALDGVVARALERNLPWWVINHATGNHGFDIDEDSPTSREIVRAVLAFLAFHLGAEAPTRAASGVVRGKGRPRRDGPDETKPCGP